VTHGARPPTVRPRPRRREVERANLPWPTTRLVERRKEVASIVRVLRDPDVRLVTLTGPPGIGKTRLALEVAEAVLARFADGVYLVDLAPIRDPGLVPATIAQVLGISDMGTRSIEETLAHVLHDKQVLLLLDNFEQLLPAAPMVTRLLAGCSRLKVLVTSRASLRLAAEHQIPVRGLGVPDRADLASLDALAQVPSVRLFNLRAAAVQPGWQLTRANAEAVAEICTRLDGLPLAIELAAARVKVLTPQTLVPRLAHALDVLVEGKQDQPPRHQTMRTAIDWSYRLLSGDEQALFRQLGVFAGGWTAEAAAAVHGTDSPEPSLELLRLLDALADKNLVSVDERADGEVRFGMLQTLREFALEQLAAEQELAGAHRRYALYYLHLARQAERAFDSAAQPEWLERLERDHDNVRAALDWCTAEGDAASVETGLWLGAALWFFWDVRGYGGEARERLRHLLALPAAQQPRGARARALQSAAWMAYVLGDAADGLAAAEESLALARDLGDGAILARSLAIMGVILGLNTDQHGRAEPLLTEALGLGQALEDTFTVGFALFTLGRIAMVRGEHDRAVQHHEDCLAASRRTGNTWGVSCTLYSLAFVAVARGDLGYAVALQQESLSLNLTLRNTRGMALNVDMLAVLALRQHQVQRAARLFAMADVLCDAANYALPPALVAWHAQGVAAARGQMGETAFRAAWRESRALPPDAVVLYAGGTVARREGRPDPGWRRRGGDEQAPELSAREVEIVLLVVGGLTDGEIADELTISPRTVDAHLRRIFARLGLRSRTQLAIWAVGRGLAHHLGDPRAAGARQGRVARSA